MPKASCFVIEQTDVATMLAGIAERVEGLGELMPAPRGGTGIEFPDRAMATVLMRDAKTLRGIARALCPRCQLKEMSLVLERRA